MDEALTCAILPKLSLDYIVVTRYRCTDEKERSAGDIRVPVGLISGPDKWSTTLHHSSSRKKSYRRLSLM